MLIETGTEYQISTTIKEYFNSADILTVIRDNGITVQFTLGEGKSRGSMPVQHLHYLLKKADLTLMPGKGNFLKEENSEEHTG